MENQVSIIINGTRYDAVEHTGELSSCEDCVFWNTCDYGNLCTRLIGDDMNFVKSTKSFEP